MLAQFSQRNQCGLIMTTYLAGYRNDRVGCVINDAENKRNMYWLIRSHGFTALTTLIAHRLSLMKASNSWNSPIKWLLCPSLDWLTYIYMRGSGGTYYFGAGFVIYNADFDPPVTPLSDLRRIECS